jgi:nucleoside-diphosphate-sugar epimerase
MDDIQAIKKSPQILTNSLAADLDYVLLQTAPLWEQLRDQQIFITGGTGFFGCWLLESFVWINAKLNLNAKAVVLTRDPSAFANKCPHLFAQPDLHFHQGDARNFTFPEGEFSHVIHAATEASVTLNENNPLLMLDTITQGTKQALEFARHCGAKRFLLVSSGAVYGKQPATLSHLSEDYPCQPNIVDSNSAYAVGKCTAEHMACLYAKQYGLDVKIARCFAFVGPYLPLDIHFAIGNFIRDALKNNFITVQGDGTAYRSYLYAADLVIWLWHILIYGQTGRPYNVGSDEAVTIAELAQLVSNNFPSKPPVKILQTPSAGSPPHRYVPDVTRAQNELGLTQKISLIPAIQATLQWYSNESRESIIRTLV